MGLSQRYEAANQIYLLWAQLLPPELAQHCRVVDLSGGLLTVEADSPSYMYELRISSHQLVGYLRQGCPAAKVRAIKITLAP
jgi:predicted nucleic acid-binding Zn ribbon protein